MSIKRPKHSVTAIKHKRSHIYVLIAQGIDKRRLLEVSRSTAYILRQNNIPKQKDFKKESKKATFKSIFTLTYFPNPKEVLLFWENYVSHADFAPDRVSSLLFFLISLYRHTMLYFFVIYVRSTYMRTHTFVYIHIFMCTHTYMFVIK